MGLTTDPEEARNSPIGPNGQQEMYLVLSEEERAKGFVRPVRTTYKHRACGTTTTMGTALAETYARQPSFYGGTFCVHCGKHFPLQRWDEEKKESVGAFLWMDGQVVGQ